MSAIIAIRSAKGHVENFIANQAKQHPWIVKIARFVLSTHALDAVDSKAAMPPKLDAGSFEQLRQLEARVGEDSLTGKILRTFGGIHAFNIPRLEWQDRFQTGGTEYSDGSIRPIDGIRPSDMSHPVMWGIDRWRRLYIATKMEGVTYPYPSQRGIGVETFFQRYSDDGNIWTSGDHYGLPAKIISNSMGDKEFDLFQKLIKGQVIKLIAWYNRGWKVKLAK